jgi:6-phosphogluconate dehydrogenase
VFLMVQAGKAVDELIGQLEPLLARGDILIDGGNSFFQDTIRRSKAAEAKGLLFIGTGVSGGEEGALRGPSMMPGGHRAAYDATGKIFRDIAAKVGDDPCCAYIGTDGAGHYVKMVHNGIEYGDMELISEAYFIMKNMLGMSHDEMHEEFARWNRGDLESYLIEITAEILAKKDGQTGEPLVEAILDRAGQKGTGKWTSQSALDLGVAAPTIAEAVFARCVSAIKSERVEAAKLLAGPGTVFTGDRKEFVEAIRDALYASKICSYAQGFSLLRAAAAEYKWDLRYGEIASIWRGGCIIRARFLGRIKEAYDRDPGLANLILDPYFRGAATVAQLKWRRVVATATELGVPIPAFSSALSWFDSYRSARLPANMIQAQRDYFGAHTYERVDRPGSFHTEWTKI